MLYILYILYILHLLYVLDLRIQNHYKYVFSYINVYIKISKIET